MIADWFWWLATSHIALSIVATLLVAALVVGFVPFLKYAPVIGPYVPVAKLAAFLSFGLLCALLDRRSADTRAELSQLRLDLAFSQSQLANQKAAAADKARLAAASGAAAVDAQMKANDYEQRLASRPLGGCALDDDDVRGLQDIRPRRAGAVLGGADSARLRGFAR
jgi:hypothetical protein